MIFGQEKGGRAFMSFRATVLQAASKSKLTMVFE
jgi:hypothetical protein